MAPVPLGVREPLYLPWQCAAPSPMGPVTMHENGARVVVLDRGPGFPPETGADAFQLFHRSPSAAARVPGTGIGLYVARALVEAQGGRTWLHDRPGGGAEIGCALPRYEPDAS